MSEEKKEECCKDEKSGGCGCGCCCGRALLILLVFLVGGIIGFLAGKHGMCSKMAKCPVGTAAPMEAMATPAK